MVAEVVAVSTERCESPGPEGTLAAVGCLSVVFVAGVVVGILFSVVYLWLVI